MGGQHEKESCEDRVRFGEMYGHVLTASCGRSNGRGSDQVVADVGIIVASVQNESSERTRAVACSSGVGG